MTLHVFGSGDVAITKTRGAPVAKDRVYNVKRLFKRSQQDARDSGLVEELEIVVLFGSSAVAVGEKEL